MSDEVPSYLRTSPEPWRTSSKWAILEDLDGNTIAVFGEGHKAAVDLNNRNRAGACVNALKGISKPRAFGLIARRVAYGEMPPAALKAVIEEEKVFTVRGTSPEGEGKTLDPTTLSDALYLHSLFHQSGGTGIEVLYIPTDQTVRLS